MVAMIALLGHPKCKQCRTANYVEPWHMWTTKNIKWDWVVYLSNAVLLFFPTANVLKVYMKWKLSLSYLKELLKW